jgi:hypothetical protein
MVDSAIIEKIAKLRRLSTSSNINEAMAATKAAEKLIAEYRISEAGLEMGSEENTHPVQKDEIPMYNTGRIIPWKNSLAIMLAKHYGCACYNHTDFSSGRKVSNYTLVGRRDDTEICRYMFSWLSLEIDRLCKMNCKGEGHVFCQSYCQGAVHGVYQQLKDMKDMLKNSATASQTAAIIKLDSREHEATVAMHQLIRLSNNRGPGSRVRHSGEGYSNGVEAGKRINLHKNLEGRGSKLLPPK